MLPSGRPNPFTEIIQGLPYSPVPGFPTTGLGSPYYNPVSGVIQNPAFRPALFAGGGAALGSTIAGPIGGAIGGGAGPFLSNLIDQEKEPLEQVAVQAGLAAIGGGLGSTLGPLGAAAGAGAGSYLGQQLRGPQYDDFSRQLPAPPQYDGFGFPSM